MFVQNMFMKMKLNCVINRILPCSTRDEIIRRNITNLFPNPQNCNITNKSYEETDRLLTGEMYIVSQRANPAENTYCRHKLSFCHPKA